MFNCNKLQNYSNNVQSLMMQYVGLERKPVFKTPENSYNTTLTIKRVVKIIFFCLILQHFLSRYTDCEQNEYTHNNTQYTSHQI